MALSYNALAIPLKKKIPNRPVRAQWYTSPIVPQSPHLPWDLHIACQFHPVVPMFSYLQEIRLTLEVEEEIYSPCFLVEKLVLYLEDDELPPYLPWDFFLLSSDGPIYTLRLLPDILINHGVPLHRLPCAKFRLYPFKRIRRVKLELIGTDDAPVLYHTNIQTRVKFRPPISHLHPHYYLFPFSPVVSFGETKRVVQLEFFIRPKGGFGEEIPLPGRLQMNGEEIGKSYEGIFSDLPIRPFSDWYLFEVDLTYSIIGEQEILVRVIHRRYTDINYH